MKSCGTLRAPGLRKSGAIVAALIFCALLVPRGAEGQGSTKPLAKSEVIDLLQNSVPPARVEALAREKGIAFELTGQTEAELRKVGATETLLKALRELAPRAPTPPPATLAAPPVLLIEANPGSAQVYIDDEPVATTSPQGRLKLSQLAPGEHRVRLSLAGYRDHEQSVRLTAGETTTVTGSLEAVTPPASSTPQPASAPGSKASPWESVLGGGPAAAKPAAGTNVERFSIAHDHGSGLQDYCIGLMTVGNGMIQFRSMNGIHSFDFPLSAVKEAKKNSMYLVALGAFHIKLKKGTNYNFVVMSSAGQVQPPDALLAAIDQAMGKD